MADEQKEQPKFIKPDLATLRDESQGIFESLNDISKLINDSTKKLTDSTKDNAQGMKVNFKDAIDMAGKLRGFTAADLKDRNATKKMATMVAKAEVQHIPAKLKTKQYQ